MIERYPRDVLAGHIPACENERLRARRTLRDLESSVKRGAHLEFKEEAAADVCDFVETHLAVMDHKTKKRVAFDLLPWERDMYAQWNGWRIRDRGRDGSLARETGTRRYRRIFLLTAKGAGKSIVFNGFLAYMMLGEPEFFGAVCGSTEKQARRPFDEFKKMLAANPDLAEHFHLTGGKGNQPGEIRSVAPGFDGQFHTVGNHAQYQNISGPIVMFAGAEEYHTHPSAALINEIDLGSKQCPEPLILLLSNAGKSKRGPCYDEYRLGRKLLRGTAPWQDDRMYMIFEVDDANLEKAVEIEERASEDDPKVYTPGAERVWAHANPSYGVTVRKDFYAKELAKAGVGEAAKLEAYRGLFSRFCPGSGANAWLGDDTLKSIIATEEPEGLADCPCWLGIDLASTRAFSAIAITWLLPDGTCYSRVLLYLPGEDFEERVKTVYRQPYLIEWAHRGYIKLMPGRKTDWNTLAEDIIEICRDCKVQGIAYDDELSEYLLEACRENGLRFEQTKDAADAYDYPGIVFVDHPQGGGYVKGKTRQLTMARALRAVEERVMASPPTCLVEFNPVFNWMIDGCVTKITGNPQSGRRWLIPDPKANPKAFIDGPVGWCMSIDIMDWRPEEDVDVEDHLGALDRMDRYVRGEGPDASEDDGSGS